MSHGRTAPLSVNLFFINAYLDRFLHFLLPQIPRLIFHDQIEFWKAFAISGKMTSIQLFRERLSEKVHAKIPKGIVGGFKFFVLQRNLKEWHERPWAYVCEC